MNVILIFLVTHSKWTYCSCSSAEQDVVFAVLSQDNPFHVTRADLFTQHIQEQSMQPSDLHIDIIHQKWPFAGSWTIFPLFSKVLSEYTEASWLFVCDEETRVNLHRLDMLLHNFDPNEEHFLGRALYDSEPAVIHHFAFANDPDSFAYPDLAAGILLSRGLIKKLAEAWVRRKQPTDFTIDAKHELAMFIWDNGKGTTLTGLQQFCGGEDLQDQCTTTYPTKFPQCGEAVSDGDVHVAVKTCTLFHSDRVVVVKNTWAKESENIHYFSDSTDDSIPTIDLGVPNTKRGHCGKTIAIMQYYLSSSQAPWLAIVDDDTIISLIRLRRLLSCYDSSQTIALGERYGYNVVRGAGYDYITGGGGMIFSRATIVKIAETCSCPSNDSPDDMILGVCLRRLNIPIVHSRHFHQARPADYSRDFLSHTTPVSFHKHWNNDPYSVYMEWLTEDDTLPSIHEEL